jgi:hypothetical protein
MCFQYNAYQLLDLIHVYQLRPSDQLLAIVRKLADFVAGGVADDGSCRYNCFVKRPEVLYWGAAIGHALQMAHDLGLGDFSAPSEQAYRHLLTRQRADGGFDFSHKNYRWLSDRRSYPRYLAMILAHLLARVGLENPTAVYSTAASVID